jgi:murein DD-endopeptidase MepM/ murein hydrolase activator NlpD
VVDAAPGVDVDRSDDGREDLDTRPRGGDGTSGGGGGSTGSGPAASVTPTATVDVDVDADEEECGLGCQMRELVRASRDLVVAAADLGRIQREQQARQGVVDFLSRVLGWFGFDGLAESVEKWNQNQLRDQMREIRRLQREVRSLTREIAASHAENLIVPAPDEVVVDTVIGPGWVEALPAAGQEWVDEITAAAEEYDLDPRLLAALVWQESSFKPNAESNANGGNGEGAYGLAQLMPATAEGLGVDRYDPMENLLGGARYLREQLDRFGSNELALAAYNAGPGNVQEYGGIPPFEETQAYVPRVLGFYETLMQADANHGAAPEPEPRVVAAGEFPNDGKASDAAPILAFPIDMSTRDTNPNDHKAVTFGDDYHYRKPSGRLHEGVDIFAARGTPVLATADGVVARTGHNPDMSGYYIVITHDNGYETKYMHLNNDNPGTDDGQGGEAAAFAPGLGAGTRVEAGQVIGYVGDSGNAEGTQPHVHFELLKNGEHTSPYPGLQSSWGDRGGSPGIDW